MRAAPSRTAARASVRSSSPGPPSADACAGRTGASGHGWLEPDCALPWTRRCISPRSARMWQHLSCRAVAVRLAAGFDLSMTVKHCSATDRANRAPGGNSVDAQRDRNQATNRDSAPAPGPRSTSSAQCARLRLRAVELQVVEDPPSAGVPATGSPPTAGLDCVPATERPPAGIAPLANAVRCRDHPSGFPRPSPSGLVTCRDRHSRLREPRRTRSSTSRIPTRLTGRMPPKARLRSRVVVQGCLALGMRRLHALDQPTLGTHSA